MKVCTKCGSYSVYDDPDERLCDKCWRDRQIDDLKAKVTQLTYSLEHEKKFCKSVVNQIGEIYQIVEGPSRDVGGNEVEAVKQLKAERDIAKAAVSACSGVFAEVQQERRLQDKRWGGPLHDDQHSRSDFSMFIYERIGGLKRDEPYRQRMIEIAALAVAAVESFDRQNGMRQDGCNDYIHENG